MIGCVLLAVIVIGSGAFMYQSRGGIYRQSRRRVALELATARLEFLRVSAYDDLCPGDASTWFLSRSGGGWQLSRTDPGEAVTAGGVSYPIRTTVRCVNVEYPDREYIELTVRLPGVSGTGDPVEISTMMAR